MASPGTGTQSAARAARGTEGPAVFARRVIAGARDGLRAYWGTAALVALACALTLAATLPVARFATWSGGLGTRLRLAAAQPFDAGFLWLHHAAGPAQLRQTAVQLLFQLLDGIAVGLLAVGGLTVLALFAARASARGPEIAIRRAVGAPGRGLLGALAVEGAVVGGAALLCGGAVGLATARGWRGAWPGSFAPALGHPGGVLVIALLGTVLLGALFPALFVRRPARSGAVDPTPLALVVPALELGLSLTVLVAAAMLRRGSEDMAPPPGTASAGTAAYEIGTAQLALQQRAAAYAELLRQLEADSGVRAASLSSVGALMGLGSVAVAAGDSAFYAVHMAITPGSFRALGLHLIAGRRLTMADGWASTRVAVVSRSAVFRSHVVHVGGLIHLGLGADAEHTVVGVVDDVRPTGLGGSLEPRYVVYTSALQHPPADAELLVKSAGGAGAAVRTALRDAFGGAATVTGPVSEATLFSAEAAPLRWFARALSIEAWAMLALAAFGTFAVMWLWVTSILGELGLRRAAGARRRDVLRYVLAQAAAVACWGVAFGTWLGMMVWDAVHRMSATLPAWDPGALFRSSLLLAAAALAGAWMPAWRAAHQPPAALVSGSDA